MRKITYLLSLFFVMAATAMAQTYRVPEASTIMTAEELRNLTTETPIAYGPVQTGAYGQWYNGTANTTTTFTEENIFIWEPILEGGVATGKGYIRKRSITTDDNYLQPANPKTFGAKGTAQVFYPAYPTDAGTGNTKIGYDNINTTFDKTKMVRFVREDSNGADWFNFNGMVYNTGTGIWTGGEIRNASTLQTLHSVRVNHVCNGTTFATTTEMLGLGAYTVTPTTRVGMTATNLNFTIDAETTEVTVNYNYDATALPFTTTGKYNLFILRSPKKRVTYNSENNKCDNGGTESSSDDAAKFYFEGDNVSGFTIKNVAAGNDKALGGAVADKAIMTFATDVTDKFVLENNSSHLVFRNAANANGYMNDINSQIGYWTDGRASTDAGGSLEFVEMPDAAINVTYNYYYLNDSQLYTTTTAIVTDGDFTAPSVKFLKNVSQSVENVDATHKTVNVICEQGDDLPFTPSASFETATWYLMDIHSNASNNGDKVFTVYADGNNVRIVELGTGANFPYREGKGMENEQWCFIGNVYDGFKIYSRTAGSGLSIYQPSDGNVVATLSAEGQGFRLYDTDGTIPNSTAFKINGRSYYLNHQGTELKGWTSNDGGSSFRFYAVTHTITLAEVIQGLLDEVNGRFPSKAADVDFEPTWPSEYENGGFADFDFLTKVQQAVTDNDETALADYKNKLNTFISLSNQHGYPISIVLEYPKKEYGTAYLPFNTAKPDDLTLYTCDAVNGNELTLVDAGSFKKNYAYVVKAEESVRGKKRQIISYGNQKGDQENTSSLLKGTHDGCVAPTGSNVLQSQGDVLGFYLVDGSKTINVPAGKCYLQEEASSVSRFVFPEGDTTGIDAIFDGTQTENAPAYDLSGRRVKNAAKGIYIIGGKKVLVK